MYCLACLSLPVSNAVVERIFSVVSAVKTKSRNRMTLSMLDAIIRIRTYLMERDKCCRDFVVTHAMLQRFTVDMHHCQTGSQCDTASLIDFGDV